MKRTAWFLVCALPLLAGFPCAECRAGEPDKASDIRRLMRACNIREVGIGYMKVALENHRKRYVDVDETRWREVERIAGEEAERVSAGLMERMVEVYDRNFTREEIRRMIRMAESPEGRMYFRASPEIHQAVLRMGIDLERKTTSLVRQRLGGAGAVEEAAPR
jgi:hypothetical protein